MQRAVTQSFANTSPNASRSRNDFFEDERLDDAIWNSRIEYPELLSDPQDIQRARINAGPAVELYDTLVERAERVAPTAEKRGHKPCFCLHVETVRSIVMSNPRTDELRTAQTIRRWARILEALGLVRRIFRSEDRLTTKGKRSFRNGANVWLVAGVHELADRGDMITVSFQARQGGRTGEKDYSNDEEPRRQRDEEILRRVKREGFSGEADEVNAATYLTSRIVHPIELPHRDAWDASRFPRKNRSSDFPPKEFLSSSCDSSESHERWNRESEPPDRAFGGDEERWRPAVRDDVSFGDAVSWLLHEDRTRAHAREETER